MPNALEMGTPEAPQIGAPNPNALQQGAPSPGNVVAVPQRPAPSHEQTVAALRHFGAIQSEVADLLKNPSLGKSNIKSSIIDGVTKLVSERIISPAQAVMQLATVPDDPMKQRGWLEQQLATTEAAQNHILEDFRISAGEGSGDVAGEMGGNTYHPDRHIEIMDSLMSHYKGRKRG